MGRQDSAIAQSAAARMGPPFIDGARGFLWGKRYYSLGRGIFTPRRHTMLYSRFPLVIGRKKSCLVCTEKSL